MQLVSLVCLFAAWHLSCPTGGSRSVFVKQRLKDEGWFPRHVSQEASHETDLSRTEGSSMLPWRLLKIPQRPVNSFQMSASHSTPPFRFDDLPLRLGFPDQIIGARLSNLSGLSYISFASHLA